METPETRRKRLPRSERGRLILEEAIRFFAEVGFEGQTRALADRLGVTQPLLYRYFPDKESLIERVFEEVYIKRWRPEWDSLLTDRSRPLIARLTVFYQDYWHAIFTPEWVRIFMFAALKGESINERYLQTVRLNVLEPICVEFRHAEGLPTTGRQPISEFELASAWTLHGSIFHIAQRKWIYKLPVPDDIDGLIAQTVQGYMVGAAKSIHRVAQPIRELEPAE